MAFNGQSALARQTLLVPETATKEKEKVEELNLSRIRLFVDVCCYSIFAYASNVSCLRHVVRGKRAPPWATQLIFSEQIMMIFEWWWNIKWSQTVFGGVGRCRLEMLHSTDEVYDKFRLISVDLESWIRFNYKTLHLYLKIIVNYDGRSMVILDPLIMALHVAVMVYWIPQFSSFSIVFRLSFLRFCRFSEINAKQKGSIGW